ncbi:hypothetical protein BBOU_1080 [Bifidobacterium boum]|uniref:Uncharacterized protein n=1 Tax=Bifidobacterium boum TaxID=78343 RepID=A0A086ZKQ8_9BIFI|nr:hypothetical protein BBOU_1080 [Bifidobacterium boum]
MTIRGEIRSEHVDDLAAAGVCTDSFIAWKNSPGACQSFIAADWPLIESVGNPRSPAYRRNRLWKIIAFTSI